MNTNIIVGLVFEHMNVEPVVAKKLDTKDTLLVFPEGEEVEKICSILQSIEMKLGHSVKFECDIATPKQVSMGDQLQRVTREKVISKEDGNMQPYWSMQE